MLAAVWLVYELLIFRDASFRAPWTYVLVLCGIGAVYLTALIVRRGRASLTMPDMADVDRALDTAGTTPAQTVPAGATAERTAP